MCFIFEWTELGKEALNSVNEKPTKIINTIFFLILTLTNFISNVFHYIQDMGCTMGTICVPNYANVFKEKFERTNLY